MGTKSCDLVKCTRGVGAALGVVSAGRPAFYRWSFSLLGSYRRVLTALPACTMSALGEFHSFRKIFRDLRKHVNVGLNLYQARRTDADSKFRDLFESLDPILEPLEEHQRKIGDRAAE